MNMELFFNQIKIQIPPLDGVRTEIADNKLDFYVDGKLEFYVRPSGGVSFETDCSYA